MPKFVATSILMIAASLFPLAAFGAAVQHGFAVKEYDRFHDILHTLEHDALPKKDFRRIRSQAPELTKRGRAIVKLGVPAATSESRRPEFSAELKKFEAALARFRADARRGTNAKLKASYSAVHDSFEMLAAMLRER